MSACGKKVNAAQTRLMLVIEILSGHEVFRLRLVDVHQALVTAGVQVTMSTVLHDLEALEHGRWAEQTDDGKWRLSAKPFQLLNNLQWGLQSAGSQVSEVQQRYTRLAN